MEACLRLCCSIVSIAYVGSTLMKLFYAPGSSSLLPHIVLREAQLAFEPVEINEHTKAISGGGDYRSVNPLGYVPAPPGARPRATSLTISTISRKISPRSLAELSLSRY
jgi:glutathione S-transferase